MPKFNPGDIIRGTKDSDFYYTVTNSKRICVVLNNLKSGNITVRVLTDDGYKDVSFIVNPAYFIFESSKKRQTSLMREYGYEK
jgi:NMD protein affecting ribosome stability and mRNA decay